MKKLFFLISISLSLFSCVPPLNSVSDFKHFEEKSDESYKNIVIYAENSRFSRKFASELYEQLSEKGVLVQLLQEPQHSHPIFPELALNKKSPYQVLKQQLEDSHADLLIRIRFAEYREAGGYKHEESTIDVHNIDVKTKNEINKTRIKSKSIFFSYSVKAPVEKYISNLVDEKLI